MMIFGRVKIELDHADSAAILMTRNDRNAA